MKKKKSPTLLFAPPRPTPSPSERSTRHSLSFFLYLTTPRVSDTRRVTRTTIADYSTDVAYPVCHLSMNVVLHRKPNALAFRENFYSFVVVGVRAEYITLSCMFVCFFFSPLLFARC